MTIKRSFSLSLLCVPWLIACGARSSMQDHRVDANVAPPSSSTRDAQAASRDAPSPGADAPLTLPDAAVSPPPCTWVKGGTQQVTEPPSDKRVHSVAVTEAGVLVAWQVTNPDPPADNTRRLQRLTFLGERDGKAEALFPPPGALTSYGSIQLAAGPHHYGATVWDQSAGCRFRPIDARGHVLGDWSTIEKRVCASLRSTKEGFSLLSWDYGLGEHRLLRLDPLGTLLGRSEPIPALAEDVRWWATTQLPGGDYLVAGMHSGFDAQTIQTQRLDAAGAAQGAPHVLAVVGSPARRVRLVQTPQGVLAAWLERASSGLPEQHQRVVVQPLDWQGAPLGAARRLDEAPLAFRDSRWSLAHFEDQLLAAWVVPAEGDATARDTTLVIQPLTLQGAVDGPSIELGRGRFIRNVVLRITPRGAVALFTQMRDAQPHQIYSAALLCERRL